MQIAPSHDPVDSAIRMVEFAKEALAHSRTVLMPNTNQPITVSPEKVCSLSPLAFHSKGLDLAEMAPSKMQQPFLGTHFRSALASTPDRV